MWKILQYLIFWLFVAGLSVTLLQAQDKQEKKLAKIMDDKLRYSQNLLSAIALNDFKRVETNAEKLIGLSRQAEWRLINTPKFEMHNNEFQRACESMIQKAKAKNMDGVTLAYFEMTVSCVRCHKYVREVRDARAPDEQPLYLTFHR